MAPVIEEQWQTAFKLDKVGRHLLFAYKELQDLQHREALHMLDKTIADLRKVIPNAFPATYSDD
jgi:hypothetical protein